MGAWSRPRSCVREISHTMVLTKDTIARNRSMSPRKIFTAPPYISTPSDISTCSSSPSTSSSTWDQIANQNDVENFAELSNYYKDVRFIAVSGKRKCGKDYFAEQLRKEIMDNMRKTAAIIHISEPIKRAFAEKKNLDLEKLMSSSEYKEVFRRHMVRWGEAQRRKDPTVFCRKALEYLMQDSPFKPAFVIIADCRRPSDLDFFSGFNQEYPLLHFRISASSATRRSRGWIFSRGIDDAETECALDERPFDVLIINESDRTLKLSMKVALRAISGKPLRKIMSL